MRSSEDLRGMFSQFGAVKDARVIMEASKTGSRRHLSKGYGFVSFEDPRDNLKAVTALDGKRNGHGRRIKVMPAESSGASAAVNEEDRSVEDPLVNEDYFDPQSMSAYADNMGEGSVFEEEHLTVQAHEEGNMHVCMIQGLPNYMEDNWAVLLPPGASGSASDDVQIDSGCGDAGPGSGRAEHAPNNDAGGGGNEDRLMFTKQDIAYYGVFDGHNGYRCSLYAREMLLQNIQRELPETGGLSVSLLKNATRQAYLKTDEEFIGLGMRDGSCVVTGERAMHRTLARYEINDLGYECRTEHGCGVLDQGCT
jgi:hypothetical protein